MAKVAKEALYLVSSEGTGFFYTLRVNKKKRRGDQKLSLKKYDPIAQKYVLFEEKKLSALKKKYVKSTSSEEA
ncbi:MAG: 50S ribosomal protein L33 [Bdellovibrionota bacterium]|jgi:ribosomal protein L33